MSEFESIKVSTKTIVVHTNINFHIDRMFEVIPYEDVPLPPYLKSKKEIKEYISEHTSFPDGTIISMEYENQLKGILAKHFRNAMTIIMIIDNKMVNCKIPRRGKIQMTGCKFDKYSDECVKHLWRLVYTNSTPKTPLYEFNNGGLEFQAIFRIVMTNKNFNLGFLIDREQLNLYINKVERDTRSLLETTFGYTGLNIKKPVQHRNTMLKMFTFTTDGVWVKSDIEYDDYLTYLSPKDYSNEISKKRYNSFLVFQSGSAIMSGMNSEYMEDDYYEFRKMITRCKDIIEDKCIE